MDYLKEDFRKNIFNYCISNVGKKVMFTAFTHLYPLRNEDRRITPQNLANLTNELSNDLVNKGIIEEVCKPKCLVTFYPMYRILYNSK